MILCFDIGGTNFRYGLWDKEKDKFIFIKQEVTAKNREKFFYKINSIINEYNAKKVGIAFPGNVNKNGEILFSPNLPFLTGNNLKKQFSNNIDIKIENDANCATIGSLHIFNEFSDIITITIGTGIGGGVVLNRTLINNSRNIGFEFGHIVVKEDGSICGCGKKGCIEAYASSSGMVRRYNNLQVTNFEQIYSIAKKGDDFALKIVEEGFFFLGVFTSIIGNIFAPEIFVFTGGISNKFEEFKTSFLSGYNKNILNFLKEKILIKVYNRDNLGLVGAAKLFS